jgi:hypothetical protein
LLLKSFQTVRCGDTLSLEAVLARGMVGKRTCCHCCDVISATECMARGMVGKRTCCFRSTRTFIGNTTREQPNKHHHTFRVATNGKQLLTVVHSPVY